MPFGCAASQTAVPSVPLVDTVVLFVPQETSRATPQASRLNLPRRLGSVPAIMASSSAGVQPSATAMRPPPPGA